MNNVFKVHDLMGYKENMRFNKYDRFDFVNFNNNSEVYVFKTVLSESSESNISVTVDLVTKDYIDFLAATINKNCFIHTLNEEELYRVSIKISDSIYITKQNNELNDQYFAIVRYPTVTTRHNNEENQYNIGRYLLYTKHNGMVLNADIKELPILFQLQKEYLSKLNLYNYSIPSVHKDIWLREEATEKRLIEYQKEMLKELNGVREQYEIERERMFYQVVFK